MRPDIEAIRKRCEKTSRGPWENQPIDPEDEDWDAFEVWNVKDKSCISSMTKGKDNAEFISHARTDIPDLLAYIAELESENRWIPVSEMLPDEGRLVLGCATFLGHATLSEFYSVEWNGVVWILDAPSGTPRRCHRDFITHWRPLPKGPEERK